MDNKGNYNINDASEYAHKLGDAIPELDFEVDGIVIKVNSITQRQELGNTTKSPRWVIAYKWEKYEAVTRVKEIEVTVGKSGTLTPLAHLEPVEIAGTTVSRSTLHNKEQIDRLDVREGDWVVVEKAGKIIPHVLRVEEHRRADDAPPEGVEAAPIQTVALVRLVAHLAERRFGPDPLGLVRSHRWSAAAIDQEFADREGLVADHPGREARARSAGEQPVVRIGSDPSCARPRRLAVGRAGHDQPVQRLDVPFRPDRRKAGRRRRCVGSETHRPRCNRP